MSTVVTTYHVYQGQKQKDYNIEINQKMPFTSGHTSSYTIHPCAVISNTDMLIEHYTTLNDVAVFKCVHMFNAISKSNPAPIFTL